MCFDLTKVATTFKLDFLFLAASPRGSRRPLVNAVSRGKPTVTFLSNDRPNLHYLKSNGRRIRYRSVRRRVALGRYRVAGAILTFETVLEKISCRRKLQNTTERHQNTLSMPPVTTRRPPSTTMPDITKGGTSRSHREGPRNSWQRAC